MIIFPWYFVILLRQKYKRFMQGLTAVVAVCHIYSKNTKNVNKTYVFSNMRPDNIY